MRIEFGPVWNGIERVPLWEYTDPDPKYTETVIGTWVVDVPWAMPEARQHLVAVGQALGQKDYTIFCFPIVSPILATPKWPITPPKGIRWFRTPIGSPPPAKPWRVSAPLRLWGLSTRAR